MAEEQPPTANSQTPLSATDAAPLQADAAHGEGGDLSSVDPAAIDEMLQQASFEDVGQAMGNEPAPVTATAAPGVGGETEVVPDAFAMPNFQKVMAEAQVSSIDLLRDVDLNVKIELGRSRMLVEDVLKLGEGSVVELDKLAGDPVDVFVNERLVARGEVLVLNDNFCVRINEIVAGVKEEGL
jgi:flagellar motor switch protein FliN/FliY